MTITYITSGTINASDINQAINILKQPGGGTQGGDYWLGGPAYTTGAVVSMYIPSLSRGTAIVSVTVDVSIRSMTNLSGTLPTADTTSSSGFHLRASSSATNGNCFCAGLYTIQY